MPISQNQFEELAKSLPGVGTDPHSVRQRVEALEKLLERSFVIPGTKIPFGLDSVIGLVPVIGDLITAAMGAYMVWEARNLGMSKWQLMRMSANIGIDTALGAIPLVGDAFDFIWRSNSKNLRIIHKHLDKHHPGTRIIEG
ncbi:DUF4112 domain-containing protein [Sphingorhabdus pulchriflava]|uniref:DUF4112 domain-containing protein n=1 Tax=Sphingorhabdus pulchriflava TaxID=2292257 RepID=A0A371B2H5_9SPHN|nr:DUF4112 domain-containing protein [Sphingorhabdus pulchriflava]RDV01717.1 DUF4112 domain-containing protein [Sphingorhabdus pulchriflava]